VWRQRIERVQVDGRHDQQQGPGKHLHDDRDHRRNEPDGGGQQDDAKRLFDRLHPRARLRQQGTGRQADRQQWGAHAEPHGEQCCAAEDGVAAAPDVEQGAGQRAATQGRR
jgi:hypothetical protein